MTLEEHKQNCVIIPYKKPNNAYWDVRFAREWCEENYGKRGLYHPSFNFGDDDVFVHRLESQRWSAQYLMDGVSYWFLSEENKMLFWLLWG